jgi:hypothetical protein
MALGEHQRFTSYPAIFDAVTIADIENVAPSQTLQMLVANAAGLVDPQKKATISVEPRVGFSTKNFDNVLSGVGLMTGLAIATTGEIQYQKRIDGGLFAGNLAHVTLNSTKGFLHIESLRARQDEQQPAVMSLVYHALRVGTNAPFVVNLSQTLSGTPAVTNLYKLGPVVFEGTTLADVQGATVNTGIRYTPKRAAGNTAAAVGSITRREPTIELELDNLEIAGTVSFGGTLAVSTGLDIYFQRVGSAAAATDHIKVAVTAGVYYVPDISDGGENDAGIKLMCDVTANGIAISTGVALP